MNRDIYGTFGHVFRSAIQPIQFLTLLLLLAALLATSCSRKQSAARSMQPSAGGVRVDPLALVLAEPPGPGALSNQIARLQQQVRDGKSTALSLEQLGWTFAAKARESFDPGCYKLAEQCALALERYPEARHAAFLLRGCALDNLHQFREAEALARTLVAERGAPMDFGLLGDALMEQGRIDDAIEAYQKMADLKPDLHAHMRIAHVRWLKGDVEGAIESMQVAAGGVGSSQAEFAAWVWTRLGGYEFQTNGIDAAGHACDVALQFQPDYPPALLLRGRLLMAQGQYPEAVRILAIAAERNPLPEYQWALADALRESGQEAAASAVERALRSHGIDSDPRSYSLFLATRGEAPDIALRLARCELDLRHDVFTHDAIAWSLAATGKPELAYTEIKLALAEGTVDARLYLHAAIVAQAAGRPGEAYQWMQKSDALMHLLLPSERKLLQNARAQMAARETMPVTNALTLSARGY